MELHFHYCYRVSWLIDLCVIHVYGQCVNPSGCLTLTEFAVWLWMIKCKEFERIFCGAVYVPCYRAFHCYVRDLSRIWACLTKANVMAVLFLSRLECATVTCLCPLSEIPVVQYLKEMASVKHGVFICSIVAKCASYSQRKFCKKYPTLTICCEEQYTK